MLKILHSFDVRCIFVGLILLTIKSVNLQILINSVQNICLHLSTNRGLLQCTVFILKVGYLTLRITKTVTICIN